MSVGAAWSGGKIDPGPEKREGKCRAQGFTFGGIIPTGNAGIAPREWRRNVVFQIIVMIFLVTQTFDICHDPACGGKIDWRKKKQCFLSINGVSFAVLLARLWTIARAVSVFGACNGILIKRYGILNTIVSDVLDDWKIEAHNVLKIYLRGRREARRNQSCLMKIRENRAPSLQFPSRPYTIFAARSATWSGERSRQVSLRFRFQLGQLQGGCNRASKRWDTVMRVEKKNSAEPGSRVVTRWLEFP